MRMQADKDPYFVWVDQVSRRCDQLQSHERERRSSLIDIDSAILFLCGGLAAGLLSRHGERLADGPILFLKWLASRRREKTAASEPSGPGGDESNVAAASVNMIIQVIISYELQDFARATVTEDLSRLGFDQDAASGVAMKMLAPADIAGAD